ncbi:MAG TPA: cytochrome c peroxidase [Opitutus sp.]|nr:cytochrome c peroxidase [Opitutus sp.]
MHRLRFVLAWTFVAAAHASDPTDAAALGGKLFFDPILSADRTVSCASCHKPEYAFADNAKVSLGLHGQPGTRNTPSAMNVSGRLAFFWDERAGSLEEQALAPIANPAEMGLPVDEAVARLNADEIYRRAFATIFEGPATEKNLARALAEFERTLETADTPYDRYIAGDDSALSPEAARGRLLFIGKANCANCHSGEDFTADRPKSIGLYNAKELNDPGRGGVTQNPEHMGLFKTPSLRNVAVTAPYMHNGMFTTLREVVDYYNHPDRVVAHSINRDKALDTPLNLTDTEIHELVAFLESLTDDRFVKR